VDEAKLHGSMHKTNTCTSCHADVTSKHPDDNVAVKPPACATCHEAEATQYAASIHAKAAGMALPAPLPVRIVTARTRSCRQEPSLACLQTQLAADLPSCHSNPGLTKEFQIKNPRRRPNTRRASTGAPCSRWASLLPLLQ